eukprot:gnl/TRDRNA2_/TRDRNA2_81126_c0_seq2.p1 gnl/TRDRNA2_/TRDRNA2_81126_c0~~gnl/TRDRNA2_/TRDRNA2_81126_c0_seq2.p1  ORF type:complete len:612 (+),score=85.41 gnl/TRDRNA2_/TRDRNA2_81126_c0_seq2:205-1836(+)
MPPEGTPENSAAVGVSTGWMPATVAEDYDGHHPAGILVRLHGRFCDAYNQDPEPVNGMYWRVKPSLVRPMGSSQPPAVLSLFVVRWWDYFNQKQRKSRSHNVANEEMILDVLDGQFSPHALLGERGEYQVTSAFIRGDTNTIPDLESLGSLVANSMRGRCRVGLYFLWPSQRPSRLAAFVPEPPLFALMKRMEESGVRTCWPHPSRLYRQLAGKLWVPSTSRDRAELQVPPTVQVNHAQWQAGEHQRVAEDAIAELRHISKARGGSAQPTDPYRGVVKLGFSWMGEDVRPFTGVAGLVKVLQQSLEGVRPGGVCLVQERIEDTICEIRVICNRDRAAAEPEAVRKDVVRLKLHPPNPRHADNTFALTSHLTMNAAEASEYAFGGSLEAYKAAEKEVLHLTDRWLQWFRDEDFGIPHACRFDFLVAKAAGGVFAVWTTEVSECGASLCGLHHGPRTAAFLNECLVDDDSGRFPRPLPPSVQQPAAKPTQLQPKAKAKPAPEDGAESKKAQQQASAIVQPRPSRMRSIAVLVAIVAFVLFRLRRR